MPEAEADDAHPSTRTPAPAYALRRGTRVHDCQIEEMLGEGGFGIVYLATDLMLERQVAIKEYLPSSIATRFGDSLDVRVKIPIDEETFALGLKSFLNEARLLARFDHPALLKVHRFWEANGTAYMVMPFYSGRTLQRELDKLGRRPDEAELRSWLEPLLDALHVLHAAQCYHRDIAPDNILITPNGPVLLDFGAARRVIGDQTKTLTVVLKPGFAPIEQYGESAGLHQGAWTDIYALAGVLYNAITGQRPLQAVGRLMEDRQAKVSETAAGRYSAPFLHAIDRALALRPQERPQSVAEFRLLMNTPVALAGGVPDIELGLDDASRGVTVPRPPAAAPAAKPAAPAPAPKPKPSVRAAGDEEAPQARRGLLVAGAGVLGAALVGAWWFARAPAPLTTQNEPSPPAPLPTPAPAQATAPAPPEPRPLQAPEPPPERSLPAALAPAPGPEAAFAPAPAPAALRIPTTDTLPTAGRGPALAPAPAPAPPPVAVQAPAPAPAPTPRPPTPRTEPPRKEPAPTTNEASVRAKCSDILAKGSLEPLTAAETAFLRRECR